MFTRQTRYLLIMNDKLKCCISGISRKILTLTYYKSLLTYFNYPCLVYYIVNYPFDLIITKYLFRIRKNNNKWTFHPVLEIVLSSWSILQFFLSNCNFIIKIFNTLYIRIKNKMSR